MSWTVITMIISFLTFSLVCGMCLLGFIVLEALQNSISLREEYTDDGFSSGSKTSNTVPGEVVSSDDGYPRG